VQRSLLANAYAVAGGYDEKAARILGVGLGSARLAKKWHLDAAATAAGRRFDPVEAGRRPDQRMTYTDLLGGTT